jgi:hypothetical protein
MTSVSATGVLLTAEDAAETCRLLGALDRLVRTGLSDEQWRALQATEVDGVLRQLSEHEVSDQVRSVLAVLCEQLPPKRGSRLHPCPVADLAS